VTRFTSIRPFFFSIQKISKNFLATEPLVEAPACL